MCDLEKELRVASLLVLNGPNLNLLGLREPGHYGSATLNDVEAMCRTTGETLGVNVVCQQSNHEGAMIDALHAARETHIGVVLNAGGYTHTSVALRDAISAIKIPVIEVHISNIHARETFRHTSLIAPVCAGSIAGLGPLGYDLAIRALVSRSDN